MAPTSRFATSHRRAMPMEGCMSAHIRLRNEDFENWCGVRGHRSKAAMARFIGVSEANLGRVLKGERAPGADFIAAVCTAFVPWRPIEKTFAALFVIEVEDACDAGKKIA